MLNRKAKKWPYIIFLVYLVLAITGSYTFLPDEAFCSASLKTDRLGAPGFLSSIAYAVHWVAEDPSVTGKAHEQLLSVLRNGFFRIFILAGIYAAAIFFARSFFPAMKNDNTLIKKKSILLKLRI